MHLAARIDSSKSTWFYNSPVWTDNTVFYNATEVGARGKVQRVGYVSVDAVDASVRARTDPCRCLPRALIDPFRTFPSAICVRFAFDFAHGPRAPSVLGCQLLELTAALARAMA